MITVKFSDLFKIVLQLQEDNMDFVNLDILEADDDVPAALSISAYQENSLEEIDYDEIEAIE